MRLSTPKIRLTRSLGELSEVALRLQSHVEGNVHRPSQGPDVDRLAEDLNVLSDGLDELVSEIVVRLRRVTSVLQHTEAVRKQKTA